MGPDDPKTTLANRNAKIYSYGNILVLLGEYMGSIVLTGLIAEGQNEFRERMVNYSIDDLLEIFNLEQPKQCGSV